MIIAARGVDQLRTREVAATVGITHASLHYHFPTKMDLIRSVLEEVIGRQIVAPAVSRNTDRPAAQRLRLLLTHLAGQVTHEPEHVIVLRELHRFADQDEAARAALEPYFRGWRRFLVELFMAGRADGSLGPLVDPQAASSLVVLIVLGMRLGGSLAPPVSPAVIDQLIALLGRSGASDSSGG